MNVITVRPNWAYAMLHLNKRIENRDFIPQALIGSRIAFHAGKNIGGSPSKPATFRGFKEMAVDMVDAGFLACPQWLKGSEPVLCWSTRDTADKKQNMLREDDCPKSVIFATAKLEVYPVNQRPSKTNWPWGREESHWWFLEDFIALDEPIECNGKQGLWRTTLL